jgi:hypothetical protein
MRLAGAGAGIYRARALSLLAVLCPRFSSLSPLTTGRLFHASLTARVMRLCTSRFGDHGGSPRPAAFFKTRKRQNWRRAGCQIGDDSRRFWLAGPCPALLSRTRNTLQYVFVLPTKLAQKQADHRRASATTMCGGFPPQTGEVLSVR